MAMGEDIYYRNLIFEHIKKKGRIPLVKVIGEYAPRVAEYAFRFPKGNPIKIEDEKEREFCCLLEMHLQTRDSKTSYYVSSKNKSLFVGTSEGYLVDERAKENTKARELTLEDWENKYYVDWKDCDWLAKTTHGMAESFMRDKCNNAPITDFD